MTSAIKIARNQATQQFVLFGSGTHAIDIATSVLITVIASVMRVRRSASPILGKANHVGFLVAVVAQQVGHILFDTFVILALVVELRHQRVEECATRRTSDRELAGATGFALENAVLGVLRIDVVQELFGIVERARRRSPCKYALGHHHGKRDRVGIVESGVAARGKIEIEIPFIGFLLVRGILRCTVKFERSEERAVFPAAIPPAGFIETARIGDALMRLGIGIGSLGRFKVLFLVCGIGVDTGHNG